MWVTVAIVVVLIALILRYTGRPKGLPPGPTCYPIIGNVGLVKPSEAVQAHRNLRKKYGDIYTIMTFHKPMIAVHGYDNIRELLVKHGDIFSDRPLTIVNGVLNKGKGLLWSSGSMWKEQRTFALTTMRKLGFGKRCLQDDQLKISVREFFAAGTETTSTTLRWALLFLIHFPDWQKKLRDNIDAVIGQSQPKMEHKEQLPLVEAFILEVQRHANLVPLAIPHAPKEDFNYKGYYLPKGTFMFFVLDSVMSDPEIFPEPTKFQPGRFLDNRGKCNGEQKEKLIPFSTGRRLCLGDSLAKMELFLFLVRFLQKFEIKPENPENLPPLEGNLGLTNMPKSFNIVLIKR